MGFLSIYQNYVIKMDQYNFKRYYTIFYTQCTSCLHVKKIMDTSQKIDKYLSI
jgi:hypothetical protein